MIKTILVVLALVTILNCVPKPHPGDLVASKAPKYSIDLNVPAKHRWDQVIPKFKPIINEFLDKVFSPLEIPDSTWNRIGLFMNTFYKYKEFLQEVKGIAKAIGVRWEMVLVANFMYEYSTFTACTSILVKDKYGNIMHGRNLDFPFQNYLSKMTAQVSVYRGSKFIGVWDQLIGGVIVLSGESQNGVSITINTRMDADLNDILDALFVKQYVPSALLSRYVLEEQMEYNEATQVMLNTNTTAPIYYTIGGQTEGMVIEKQMEGYHGYYTVNSTSTNWFYVQTNYDWGTDPDYDDRKTPAAERLKAIGQENINESNFFDLLTKFPSLNKNTIYTLMFSVKYWLEDISLWYGNYEDPITEQDKEQTYEDSIFKVGEGLAEFFEKVENGYFEQIAETHFKDQAYEIYE